MNKSTLVFLFPFVVQACTMQPDTGTQDAASASRISSAGLLERWSQDAVADGFSGIQTELKSLAVIPLGELTDAINTSVSSLASADSEKISLSSAMRASLPTLQDFAARIKSINVAFPAVTQQTQVLTIPDLNKVLLNLRSLAGPTATAGATIDQLMVLEENPLTPKATESKESKVGLALEGVDDTPAGDIDKVKITFACKAADYTPQILATATAGLLGAGNCARLHLRGLVAVDRRTGEVVRNRQGDPMVDDRQVAMVSCAIASTSLIALYQYLFATPSKDCQLIEPEAASASQCPAGQDDSGECTADLGD